MLDQVDGTVASLLLRHRIHSAASSGWSILRIHWYTSPVHGPTKCLHKLDSYLLRKGKRTWASLSIHRRVVISRLKHIPITPSSTTVWDLYPLNTHAPETFAGKNAERGESSERRSWLGHGNLHKHLSIRADSGSILAPSLNEPTGNPPCRCSSGNRIANSLQTRYVVAFQSPRCQSRCSYINMYSVKYWTWIIKINNF